MSIYEDIKRTRDKFGELYPVLVDQKGEIIDGFSRRRVNPKWKEVKVEIKEEKDREILALITNIARREIRNEEITERLGRIAGLTGWSCQRIADEVGMSDWWVRKYIPEKYKDKIAVERAHRKKEAKKAKKDLEEGGTFVSEYRSEDKDKEATILESEPFEEEPTEEIKAEPELLLSNVWEAEKSRRDYGDGNFHGNTPPIVAEQCLLKYTEEGDLVLDPMAGSGTIQDMAEELNRKCLAFDLKPMRDDIKYGDATHIEIGDEIVDFIFAHLPYWKMTQYSDSKNDLSNVSYNDFLTKTEEIFKEFKRILQYKKYCAVLIGDKRHGGKLLDLSAQVSLIGEKHLSLFDKIIFISGGQRSEKRITNRLSEWRAKKFGYHLQNFDTLLIFRKESK